MLILADRGGEAIKKLRLGVGVYLGHDQSERIVRSRLNSREDVGEGEPVVGDTRRSHASLPPDMGGAALLSDARFVLEEQSQALVSMRILQVSQLSLGSL